MNADSPRLGVIESEGAGPPVVLLHGFAGSAASWEAVRAHLARGRATLSIDLPGHGASLAYPGFGTVSFAARAVVAELDRRGVSNFHLAGHSMGGAVSVLIAIGQPQRVLSATLLAPGGLSAQINAGLLRDFAKAGNERALEACLKRMFSPHAAVPAMLVKSMAEQRRRPGQQAALAHIVGIILRGEEQGVLPYAALESLSMPMTVVWGAEDTVMAPGVLASLPAGFRTLMLNGAGHMLLDEMPGEVAAAIGATVVRAGS